MSEGRDDEAVRAERVLRARAAKAFTATEPAAREWLERARSHRDRRVAELAALALASQVPVHEATDAADRADRLAQATARWHDYLAVRTREDIAREARAHGYSLPDPVATRSIDPADGLRASTVAALEHAGLWDERPRHVRIDDLDKIDIAPADPDPDASPPGRGEHPAT